MPLTSVSKETIEILLSYKARIEKRFSLMNQDITDGKKTQWKSIILQLENDWIRANEYIISV